MRSRRHTKEEKVASKIIRELSDFELDLEQLGYYLSVQAPYVIFRRAMEMLESAEHQKAAVEHRRIGQTHDRLFD